MADKRRALVERLLEKTTAGEVNWEATETELEFQAAFTKYTVRITSQHHRDSTDYIIRIFNSEGALVEEFDDTELTADDVFSPFLVMKETHDLARRYVMGAEQALDALLDELGDTQL
jgi:hypothetical protein